MKIQQVRKKKDEICFEIISELPDWFAQKEAIKKYVKEVKSLPMFVCVIDKQKVGFVALKVHNEYTAEIYVMGVKKSFQRNGIGKTLLKKTENYLSRKGIEFLTVKTLSSSHPDKNYRKTRLFYRNNGFKPIEDFGSKIWGKENPCLLMLKQI